MIGGRAAGRDLAGSRHEHGRRRRLGPRRALWTEALRLESLNLNNAAIGDAGLVASRRRPAPGASQSRRQPARRRGARRPRGTAATGRCAAAADGSADEAPDARLLGDTQITDTGCAALAAALDSGALPALAELTLAGMFLPAPRREAGAGAGTCACTCKHVT